MLVATVVTVDPPTEERLPRAHRCTALPGMRVVRIQFFLVHIQFSVLQYLPYEIFEKVPVKSLYLKNTTLIQLFDQPPQSLDALDTLHLENTKLMR
ncbi:hypothetical protein AVEN_41432-1 [Araneus ventricosus]|uniref:Uncharacterized protein n=1 Tax=Araneus ventricosus TaxID=182803 RepID=A0A4Y2P606_ARAVE|nr:hypothetical protein AVEN_41432-1 [Araneus ventricosus]